MMLWHRARTAVLVSSVLALCLAATLWSSRSSRGGSGELANVSTSGGVREEAGAEALVQEWEYRRALQYEGTGARIQSFLEKAKSGRPFTVSVIGGSGRGLRRWQNGQYLPDLARRQVHPRTRNAGVKREDDGDDQLIPMDHAGGGRQGLPHAESPEGVPFFGTRTLYSPENMHVQIFNFLNSTFPHVENRLVNGAQGGVGSGYFGWCFKEHIPEQSDLILVELGINDLVEIDGIGTYEMLIRRLLELESQPAIINIEVFTTLFPTLLSSSSLHADVAAFYDFPSLSIRDVLLPRITANPDREMPKWFRTGSNVWSGDPKVRDFGGVSVDLMHISALGHALTANLVIKYLQAQLKHTTRPASSFWTRQKGRGPLLDAVPEIPKTTLTSPFNLHGAAHPQNAICRTMNSANLHSALGLIGPGSSLTQGIVPAEGSHGWEKFHFKEKKYLVAKKPGAKFIYHFHVSTAPLEGEEMEEDRARQREEELNDNLRQNLAKAAGAGAAGAKDVPAVVGGVGSERPLRPMGKRRQQTQAPSAKGRGTVSIGYQRSKILGFGSVLCWVDDRKFDGRIIDGWWDIPQRNMGRVAEVARDLAPGSHTLHCELLDSTHDEEGRTEFRIFAVMHN